MNRDILSESIEIESVIEAVFDDTQNLLGTPDNTDAQVENSNGQSRHNPEKFAMVYIRAIEDPHISDTQFRTLAAVSCFARKDGYCFPSLNTVAEILNKSRSTVSKHISHLEKLGYIKKKPVFKPDGSRGSNRLWITRAPNGSDGRAWQPERNGVLLSERNAPLQSARNNMLQSEGNVRENIRDQVIKGGKKVSPPSLNDESIDTTSFQVSLEEEQVNSPREIITTFKASNILKRSNIEVSPSLINNPIKKNATLTVKQTVALEAFDKASGINLLYHKDAVVLADFLIRMYAKKFGPNEYVRWARRYGGHHDEFGKYARFPKDIMTEYKLGFGEPDHTNYPNNSDKNLFENELKDFVSPELQPKLDDLSNTDPLERHMAFLRKSQILIDDPGEDPS